MSIIASCWLESYESETIGVYIYVCESSVILPNSLTPTYLIYYYYSVLGVQKKKEKVSGEVGLCIWPRLGTL